MIEAAAKNFSETYLRLGSVLTGTRRVDDPAFTALVADGMPTIANFAVNLNLDPWAVRRLGELAVSPDFRVYLRSNDPPSHAMELLQRGGFMQISSLDQMVASALEPDGSVLEPSSDIGAIADFIIAQFLSRNREIERHAMRETLIRASEIELFESIAASGDRIAAAVLSRSENVTGIYNLCVRADRRGGGIGKGFLRSLRMSVKTPYICLQCYPNMTAWYGEQGFEPVGSIHVFARNSGRVGGY